MPLKYHPSIGEKNSPNLSLIPDHTWNNMKKMFFVVVANSFSFIFIKYIGMALVNKIILNRKNVNDWEKSLKCLWEKTLREQKALYSAMKHAHKQLRNEPTCNSTTRSLDNYNRNTLFQIMKRVTLDLLVSRDWADSNIYCEM